LIGYGEADLKFRRVEKGFQVSRIYGSIEAPVGELRMGKTTYFKVSKEELRHLVEEARRTAPDLSGVKKIWHALPWFATDASFIGGQIVATTAHLWQLKWYIALFGRGKVVGGGASVTEEGIKPDVQMRWPREVLDRIIAEEGEELKLLLGPISKQGGGSRESEGPVVKSWRELVDAIDWSWVLKRVEELVGELKPWIGRKDASNVEREGLARRMLGELELLAHFAEARRGMDDGRWREERAKRLARAVEALSGGRIAGEYAERLAQAIIYYAEGHKKYAKERIEDLAKEIGVSNKEVWSIVEFVLSNMYCLARDCARDEVVRKFVEPALELIMLEKALRGEFDREETLLIFGEMYATAVAGDGHVEPGEVELTVGGELGGGAALLRLATLHLLNQLLPDELKFGVRVYVKNGIYSMATHGGDAVRFKRLLAMTAPSAGGEYLSPKFNEFVEAAQVDVWPGDIWLTDDGYVAANLTISVAGVAMKYNVYLRDYAIALHFASTDRSRAELAARLLRHAGVGAEVKKVDNRDVWYVYAYTDMLAAGREELRKALAQIVETARANGWVDEEKARRWLEKLEEGLTLKEGWPRYHVGLSGSGALDVRFSSTDRNSIQREVQRFKEMGLEEGKHFTVKMPEGGEAGYVYILRKGLEHAAWLSVRSKDEDQRKLAAAFVEYILKRAKEAGKEVYEKVQKIIEEGKAWGSQTLKGFEKEVEVNGGKHVVKVIGGGAEFTRGKGGKTLLRIRIIAEVDGIRNEYTITYGRYGEDNVALGFAMARASAPGGREADAERFAAVIKALTGEEPRIRRKKNGQIIIECIKAHLDGFARYAELADDIAKWLEETNRR
jgi:hypothetical protein